MKTEQFVIVDDDDPQADPQDCEVVFDIGLHSPNKLWFSVENSDGECTWFMSGEDWAKLKALVDKHLAGGVK